MSDYSEQSYWDGRYQLDTEPFEWYQPFATLRPYIAPIINNTSPPHRPRSNSNNGNSPTSPPQHQRTYQPSRRRSSVTTSATTDDTQPPPESGLPSATAAAADASRLRVLVLGCGCSELSIEVYRMADGSAEVHSVDFSIQCIEEMRRRYPTHPNLHFYCQDIRSLTFPDGHFDLVLDKATLDCLHCHDEAGGDGGRGQLKLAVQCLYRVMRLGGVLLSVSHAPPEQRVSHFMMDRLEVMKGQLEVEKREKAMRRVGAAAVDAAGGGSPALLNRRVSVTGSARGLGSRRSSTIASLDAMPVPLLTQPVVHRLTKPTIPADEHTHTTPSRTLTRTSSLAPAPTTPTATTTSPPVLLPTAKRASMLMDMLPSEAAVDSCEELALAEDELSAVYDSSDHYLYVVYKEMVAPPLQATQGLHSVGGDGGRRGSLVGLPGMSRRQSSIVLAG